VSGAGARDAEFERTVSNIWATLGDADHALLIRGDYTAETAAEWLGRASDRPVASGLTVSGDPASMVGKALLQRLTEKASGRRWSKL
jgi:hypothetical protein